MGLFYLQNNFCHRGKITNSRFIRCRSGFQFCFPLELCRYTAGNIDLLFCRAAIHFHLLTVGVADFDKQPVFLVLAVFTLM